MKKRNIVICVCIVICLTISGCNDKPSKDSIVNLVIGNQDVITKCIEQNDFSVCYTYPIIKRIITHSDYIEFYCGGTGMGGQTSYYGFYFFASNNVVHVMNALSNYYKGDDSLVFEEEGKGYIWKQSNGDNSLYFEKIVDKFFYYEQHY